MNLEMYYKLDIYDKNNKKIFDGKKTKSESFIRQWMRHMKLFMVNTTTVIKEKSGLDATIYPVTESSNYGSIKMDANGPSNNSNYGIVVGLSNTPALDVTNYSLGTIVVHSSTPAANCMSYGAMSFTAPTVNPDNTVFTFNRNLLNNSGSSITLREIGVNCRSETLYGGSTYYFCLIRDIISSTVVAPNQTVAVTYWIYTYI